MEYIILKNGVFYFNHNTNVGCNEKLYPDAIRDKLALCNNLIAPPSDHHDPKDGHIWWAKYIILENGVLYFNHNAYIGCNEKLYPE